MANPDPNAAGDRPASQTADATPTGSGAGPTAGSPPFVPPEADPPPFAIGPYRVLGELGRGGMGAVYRAEDPRLKREVALKVMLPRVAASPAARARFLREARAQAQVEHDHVATIFQVGEDRGVPFIAMPLLKGITLHAALRANPRPPVRAVVRIGREIAEGLSAAHEKGLVHRDIKPGNVWLEGARLRVKILDFGLARSIDEHAADATPPITADGTVIGTPAYMSPEQTRGELVDHRTDLWSLGVALYQMATGRLPFAGATAFAVQSAVTGHEPPAARELAPDLPPGLGELIGRLIAKDPVRRPPTAAAVADELRQIELGLVATIRVVALDSVPDAPAGPDPFGELTATESIAAPRPAPPAGAPRWLWPVAALFVLAAAVAVGWATGLFAPARPAPEPPGEPEPQKPKSPAPNPVQPKNPTAVPEPSAFFNGTDLTGWTTTGKGSQEWAVVNAAIVCTAAEGTATTGSLITDRTFGDFELSFRLRRPPVANSQVVFGFRRPTTAQETPTLVFSSDYAAFFKRKERVPLRPDGFNDVTIRCRGKWVTVTVNGAVLLDEECQVPAEGRFIFQCHRMEGEVVVKDIRFTDLSFFNGKDLTGWAGNHKSEWKVRDGAIVWARHEVPGNVILYSERTFGDFELSFRVTHPHSRSVGGFQLRFRAADRFKPAPIFVFGPDTVTLQTAKKRVSAPLKAGGVDDLTLRCVGKSVAAFVNGNPLIDEEVPDLPAEGIFTLHGHNALAGEIVVGDVRFRDLTPPKKP